MQHIPGLQEFKKQQFMQDAVGPFGPFYDDPSTSDIVVMAGEAKIHSHKMFLSAHSSLFKAMFQVMNAAFEVICCGYDFAAPCRLAQRRALRKK